MKNYRIHFAEREREATIGVLSRWNDIIINQVEPQAASITIQLDDDRADLLYAELLAQLDLEVRQAQTVVAQPPAPGTRTLL